MHPFRIDVSDAELLDLRERLLRTRLLPDSPHRPASGLTSAYLRSLIESWLDFDWRHARNGSTRILSSSQTSMTRRSTSLT